jgi:hypothetical protein
MKKYCHIAIICKNSDTCDHKPEYKDINSLPICFKPWFEVNAIEKAKK